MSDFNDVIKPPTFINIFINSEQMKLLLHTLDSCTVCNRPWSAGLLQGTLQNALACGER